MGRRDRRTRLPQRSVPVEAQHDEKRGERAVVVATIIFNMNAHSVVYLQHPLVKHASVASAGADRLVVFVHGFLGRSDQTWGDFLQLTSADEWWRRSDLLFVNYDSARDNITAVADRLRRYLPDFYPLPHHALCVNGDIALRDDHSAPYGELIVVGHSLGGLVVRRATVDALQECLDQADETTAAHHPLLDAQLRLFSPASAGFRPAGLLGLIRASGLWSGVELLLRQSSAFTDLQPGSHILVDTRRRTESLRGAPGAQATRANIAWANPDNVVISERYDTDPVSHTVEGQSHTSVCKPTTKYDSPWTFVKTGRPW